MSTNLNWELDAPNKYEKVTINQCISMARLYEPTMTSDRKLMDNAHCIHMCLNTWFNLCDDLGYPIVSKFLRHFLFEGCGKSIAKLIEKLNEVVAEILPKLTFENLHTEMEMHGDVDAIDALGADVLFTAWPELYSAMIQGVPRQGRTLLEDTLLILRYPKRISPLHCSSKNQQTLEKYFAVDGEMLCDYRRDNTSDPWRYPSDNFEVEHRYLVKWLREIMHELDGLIPVHDDHLPRTESFIPSGATHNTCNNPICKALTSQALNKAFHWDNVFYDRYCEHNPYTPNIFYKDYYHDPYRYHCVDRSCIHERVKMDVGASKPEMAIQRNFIRLGTSCLPIKAVTPMVVPKSFTEGRVIAPTDIDDYQLFSEISHRHRVNVLEYGLPTFWHGIVCLEDSTLSCDAARQGSIDGSIATIDASGGSDRIKKRVELCVVPKSQCDIINRCEMYLVDPKGNLRLCHMVATSGNPFTFNNESQFYGGIVELGYRIYDLYCKDDTDNNPLCEWLVIGDDVTCDSRVFDLVCQLYEIFGLKVNRSKSYGADSAFKEACGGEYFYGFDLNPLYFPRKPWERLSDRFASINNNLNRFFERVGCTESHTMSFVRHKIKAVYNRATFLPEDLANSALLGEQLLYPVHLQPHGTVERAENDQVNGRHPSSEFKPKRFIPYETYLDTERFQKKTKANQLCACRLLNWQELHLWYEFHCYQDFLANGPKYESELDRLLGVSSRRLPCDDQMADSQLIFKVR